MLLFVAVFRAAHEILVDSEKELPDAEAVRDLQRPSSAAATEDVQVDIGTISGSAFGAPPPMENISISLPAQLHMVNPKP